ncbi:MAG TPA: TetR/AcrR family transcriptional regulator [Candidatus Didemnitutus sp.]|nr:TetR/AcrR family transcriptional regulator [Candidatus Didemnitutus sp.]
MPDLRPPPGESTPKRDHLIATAFRLFYRDGYRAVGIDTILAEAKLAKMTLYHHFASKEDLIVAVLEQRSALVNAKVQAILSEAGPSPRKRLLAYFARYEAFFSSKEFNGCPFIRAVAEYPEVHSPVHQAVIRHKQKDIATLRELVSGFGIAEPSPVAQQIALLIEGALVSAHTFGNPSVLAHARDAALALVKASR